ncbi:MAG: DUF488 family protein [Thermoanaerobaculia bacterium]
MALLRAQGVALLADVRTLPRSRHNPQFNRGELGKALRRAGFAYQHWPELGGLRHPRRDSINTAWRNPGFRGFADYMQTPEFAEAIDRLTHEARRRPMALMCAEAVPWRCHRSLLADALTVRGFDVEEIQSLTRTARHRITPWGKVRGKRITYPG